MFTQSRSARSIAQRNQLRAVVVSIGTGTAIGTGTITITTSITDKEHCG